MTGSLFKEKQIFLEECRWCIQKMGFERKKIIINESESSLWCPIYTMARHEMKLYRYFEENGIPAYLPVVPDVKIHNVSYKDKSFRYENEVLRPMLKSYVFAQMTDAQKRAVWRTKSVCGVLNVTREQQSAFIGELRGLQVMEELALTHKVQYKKEIEVNDRFMIESPRQFEGTFGYLVERRKRFLWVVKLEIFGGFISAEIDPREYKFSKI